MWYENCFASAYSFQTPGERLHDRPADDILPALGLYVDEVQPELVLLNDSIDAAIARSAHGFPASSMDPP